MVETQLCKLRGTSDNLHFRAEWYRVCKTFFFVGRNLMNTHRYISGHSGVYLVYIYLDYVLRRTNESVELRTGVFLAAAQHNLRGMQKTRGRRM